MDCAKGTNVLLTNGAMLLGRSQDWDWALLRMNSAPPQGVSFRGWNATSLPFDSYVEIFHHPSGDLKKWSRGTSGNATTVNFGTAAGGGGLFTPVVWDAGTTEGGSSGGALVSFESGDAVVRGGLLGGDALCTNLDGTDYFSQFGAMLPLVRQYISPNFVVAGLVVSVEFYNGNLNHFFMTINPAEIAGLDNGTIVGWERTGFRFLAYDAPGPGRSPVCRFTASRSSATRTSSPPIRPSARPSRSISRPTGCSRTRQSTTCSCRTRRPGRAPRARSRSTVS
jgi:hypothetical protein